jgi:hypothetical protein
VPERHQVGTGNLRVVRHGRVELPLEVGDFLVALHQRGDHDVAAVGDGEVVGGGSRAAIHRGGVGCCTGLGTLVEVGNCQISPS